MDLVLEANCSVINITAKVILLYPSSGLILLLVSRVINWKPDIGVVVRHQNVINT